MRQKHQDVIIDVTPERRRPSGLLWLGALALSLAALALGVIVVLPAWSRAQSLVLAIEESYPLILWLARLLALSLSLWLVAGMIVSLRAVMRRLEPIERIEGIPVQRSQLSDALVHRAVDAALSARLLEAERSQYRNLTTYHYSSRNEQRPGAEPALTVPAPVPPMRSIESLLSAGSSPDNWLLGHSDAGEPAAIELPLCGAIAIAGVPRSGKSVTAVTLLAQALYHQAHCFVIDPHARVQSGLLASAEPLRSRLAGIAIDDSEIPQLIAQFALLARQRLAGELGSETRAVLCIDEFTSLVARGVLEQAQLSELLAVSVEASKVRCHLLLISQDWSAAAVGKQSALLRRVSTHRIIHRVQPGAAELLIPSGHDRELAALAPGSAWYAGAMAAPGVIRVPMLDQQTLASIAARAPERAPERSPLPVLPVDTAPSMPALERELTTGERIVQLLRSSGDRLDCNEIAQALDAPASAVRPALTRLAQERVIERSGSLRNYRYWCDDEM